MPHFIVEYTDNIREEMRVPELLRKGIEAVVADGYPAASMRARAIAFSDYLLVDGREDYAMVHAVLKIAPGHTVEEKTRVCHAVFEVMKSHFADVLARRYLLLSLELVEAVSGDGPILKFDNLATRA